MPALIATMTMCDRLPVAWRKTALRLELNWRNTETPLERVMTRSHGCDELAMRTTEEKNLRRCAQRKRRGSRHKQQSRKTSSIGRLQPSVRKVLREQVNSIRSVQTKQGWGHPATARAQQDVRAPAAITPSIDPSTIPSHPMTQARPRQIPQNRSLPPAGRPARIVSAGERAVSVVR